MEEDIIFSGLFLQQGDKILLLKRIGDSKMNGFWGVPGGHVNKGELFSQALNREVREEIGINIKNNNIEDQVILYYNDPNTKKKFIGYYGFCTYQGQEIINNEPNKCSKLAWFVQKKLPKDITPFARKAFEAYKNGIHLLELKKI